jgi:SAM-dependent methyltransferase
LEPITYPCGCVNKPDEDWGILRSVSKCDFHRSSAGKHGHLYYRMIGVIGEDFPRFTKIAGELTQGLHAAGIEFTELPANNPALEVASGVAPYCPLLLRLGYSQYEALEADEWAADWVRSAFGVRVHQCWWEDFDPGYQYGLILAAHIVEHLRDAPAGLRKMFNLLKPGGRVIVIVPNDEDPVNPDHLWFFTQETLRSAMERIGFQDVRMSMTRHVPQEQFIYCTAVRQGRSKA